MNNKLERGGRVQVRLDETSEWVDAFYWGIKPRAYFKYLVLLEEDRKASLSAFSEIRPRLERVTKLMQLWQCKKGEEVFVAEAGRGYAKVREAVRVGEPFEMTFSIQPRPKDQG